MQIDTISILVLLLPYFLLLGLLFLIVLITIAGWPKLEPASRLSASLSLLVAGLFGVIGYGLLAILDPLSIYSAREYFLISVVIIGMTTPSVIVYRNARGEQDMDTRTTDVALLHKSVRNSIAAALASIMSPLLFRFDFSTESLIFYNWITLIITLVVYNISTVYYLIKQHSEI